MRVCVCVCVSLQSPGSPEDLLQALLCLRAEIRTSTSSMTSVPKPLKFLRDQFDQLKEAYEKVVSDLTDFFFE